MMIAMIASNIRGLQYAFIWSGFVTMDVANQFISTICYDMSYLARNLLVE
jgi:hypothetical protein